MATLLLNWASPLEELRAMVFDKFGWMPTAILVLAGCCAAAALVLEHRERRV